MATVNVLNQMAEYDFNAEINVEIIFEDNDDYNPTIQSVQSEQENINLPVTVPVKQFENSKETKKNSIKYKKQIKNRTNNQTMLSLNKLKPHIQRKLDEEMRKDNQNNILSNCVNTKITGNQKNNKHFENRNQNESFISMDNNTASNEERLRSVCQLNEPINTFIDELLNKLSEHIVLIMQTFYHYGVKRINQNNKKREEIFHFVKYHFFELSYSTVQSICLPQEHNESFVNQFLDNTVKMANKKSLGWKCDRRHVLPFFKELLTWAKQKKEYSNITEQSSPSNGNIMLKQQLNRPLLTLNPSQSGIVSNSNSITQKTLNNLCIFSSGPPGNEISINIDANTLIQINEREQCTFPTKQIGDNNNNVPSCDPARQKTPVLSPTIGNHDKGIQKINPQYNRPLPPPYPGIPYRPQKFYPTNVNQIQNNYELGQSPQNVQNIGQPIHSYPTQVHYINSNNTSPLHSDSFNFLCENTNQSLSRHAKARNQGTCSPVITNVSSLNPKAQMLNTRCCMCGKNTTAPYNPYNPPCRQIFCSHLCRELENEFYKPKRGNT